MSDTNMIPARLSGVGGEKQSPDCAKPATNEKQLRGNTAAVPRRIIHVERLVAAEAKIAWWWQGRPSLLRFGLLMTMQQLLRKPTHDIPWEAEERTPAQHHVSPRDRGQQGLRSNLVIVS